MLVNFLLGTAQRSVAQLEQDADDLERQAQDLERMMIEADRANHAKSAFLANMSHEIRTPMTAILGFVQVLEDEKAIAALPACRDAVKTITSNGQYLLNLINDILDLAKVESSEIDLERESFSFDSLIEDVASLMGARARSKGLEFTANACAASSRLVCGDSRRIKQMIVNVVGNAIKFTEQGSININCVSHDIEDDKLRTTVDVTDTGAGLSRDAQESIFDPFVQGDPSLTRKYGGTGLGLAISRRFAQLMDGSLELVGSEVGQGSQFRITVDHALAEPNKTEATGPAYARKHRHHEAATKSIDPGDLPYRILVAEDGPDNRRLLAHILTKAGADVALVENGQEALDRIAGLDDAGNLPDAILMDMQMPVMDGYSATRALRESGVNVPIIALTAHAMSGDREKCMDAGCDEYATKPINREQLIAVIRAGIDAKQYQHEQHR